jgi:hypothetical protein
LLEAGINSRPRFEKNADVGKTAGRRVAVGPGRDLQRLFYGRHLVLILEWGCRPGLRLIIVLVLVLILTFHHILPKPVRK